MYSSPMNKGTVTAVKVYSNTMDNGTVTLANVHSNTVDTGTKTAPLKGIITWQQSAWQHKIFGIVIQVDKGIVILQ